MKKFDFIPAAVFGVALGSLITLGIRDPQRLPISLIPSLVTSMTTIVVGWWIHSAVRRRGELDRIPIDYISDLVGRIGDLISVCASDDDRVVHFRRLGIEINGLREICRRTGRRDLISMEGERGSHYIDFKRYLTDSNDAVDTGLASKASGEMRMTALKIQWRLCKYLLDRTTDADVFGMD